MHEEKETAHRLAAYSDAIFAVFVPVMVLDLRAPEQAALSASGFMAHGHQLCGELRVHRHYLDQPSLPYAVRRYSDAGMVWINFVHHCLQRVRARCAGPSRRNSNVRVQASHGETSITRCPCDFHDSYVDCGRSAATGIRSDMRRPYPPLTTRGPRR
jgi:hypothetical protein